MLDAGDWLVVVDTVNIADVSLGRRYRALQVIPHPRYNKYNNDYDVGLLHTVIDMDMTGERRGGGVVAFVCVCVDLYWKRKTKKHETCQLICHSVNKIMCRFMTFLAHARLTECWLQVGCGRSVYLVQLIPFLWEQPAGSQAGDTSMKEVLH